MAKPAERPGPSPRLVYLQSDARGHSGFHGEFENPALTLALSLNRCGTYSVQGPVAGFRQLPSQQFYNLWNIPAKHSSLVQIFFSFGTYSCYVMLVT